MVNIEQEYEEMAENPLIVRSDAAQQPLVRDTQHNGGLGLDESYNVQVAKMQKEIAILSNPIMAREARKNYTIKNTISAVASPDFKGIGMYIKWSE